jgi:chromosome segregation ATPase
MTRQDVEVEDLIKDLRDRIQYYEPTYKRKLNRLNEEALIRRAYTILTCYQMSSRDYEDEIRDLERSLESAQDEVEDLRWRLSELDEKTYA